MRGTLPRGLLHTLARAWPRLPGCSAGCRQGELIPCPKERVNKGLCHSLCQCLLSHYRHGGKSLKPLCLSGSVSQGNQATAEPTGSPPYGPSPGHQPPSPQLSSARGAQAAPAPWMLCSTSVGHAAPHSSRGAAATSHMELIRQTCTCSPQHLTLPGQCSLAPGAHPQANSCPCEPCRACLSAQHHNTAARTPHLRDHSQCLQSDKSQQSPGSVSRQ